MMFRMPFRVKTFLVLLCITGVCLLYFHQVWVPVTSNISGSSVRKVHKTGVNDDGFKHAEVLVDTVKQTRELNIAEQKTKPADDQTETNAQSGRTIHRLDLGDSVRLIDNRTRNRSWGITEDSRTESYVTLSGNGSLIYQMETDNVASEPNGISQELAEYLELGATTVMSPSALEEEHEMRIKHLQEQCREIRSLKTSLIGRGNITDFFYTPKYKFAYCKVPKSGSTFWMQLFMVLGRGDRYSKLMSHWTRAQIHERTRRFHVNPLRILRDHLKTVVVARNPFTRVYSAYIDKVFMPLFWNQFVSIQGVKVLDPLFINKTVRVYNVSGYKRPESLKERHARLLHNRQNRSLYERPNRFLDKPSDQLLRERYRRHLLAVTERNSSIHLRNFTSFQTKTQLVKVVPVCANFVTFEDFLKFIISQSKGKKALEPHWAPITHLCRPCKFNTYKIVKQESFAADVEHSLKSFGIKLSDFEGLKESLTERRAELSIPGIIGVLMDKAGAPEIQKCITLKEIAERIWKSFQIQGFISDEIDIPKRELPDNIKQLKFKLISLALDAVKRSGFTRAEQKAQRRKHLLEAYSNISAGVIRDVQSIYQLDFSLFDYSHIPPHLEV